MSIQRHALFVALSSAGLPRSGTCQSLPGIPVPASPPCTNAQIASSVDRNLSAGSAGTVSVPIIEPARCSQSPFTTRYVRARAPGLRQEARAVQLMVDGFAVFNAWIALAMNGPYGGTWQQPVAMQGARSSRAARSSMTTSGQPSSEVY